ncbi:hypothetical protein Scep_016982 [Stephania cephalantha]|uniref:Uncharacterized protein n=1 Tax=Stephania cephalantha TaxID=152367 RepID=A0AAP0INL3_9MAGN
MLGVLCWNLTNCTPHLPFCDGRVQTLLVGARRFWTTLSNACGQGPTSTCDFDILLTFGKWETD